MTAKRKESDLLSESLLRAMQALDTRVVREMQRSPAQREEEGVQKWLPFEKRVEQVAALLLEALGNEEIALDSMIIMTRAYTNALRLFIEELGTEGLGELRSDYCKFTMQRASDEARRALEILTDERIMN